LKQMFDGFKAWAPLFTLSSYSVGFAAVCNISSVTPARSDGLTKVDGLTKAGGLTSLTLVGGMTNISVAWP
jgi:hypothetical protein